MKEIIYYTDNNLDETFACKIRQLLIKSAGDVPIISVSQKPINLGTNICVGEIGRSHHSLYKQIWEAIKASKADVIYLVEHDCLYTSEHFQWDPPTMDLFYYNTNFWYVNAMRHTKNQGLFSKYNHKRYALSQLVANRNLLLNAISYRLFMLEHGWKITKGVTGTCEPGVNEEQAFSPIDDNGKFTFTKQYFSEQFETNLPNIDIRYGGNFTGFRKGENTSSELPYWGTYQSIMQ